MDIPPAQPPTPDDPGAAETAPHARPAAEQPPPTIADPSPYAPPAAAPQPEPYPQPQPEPHAEPQPQPYPQSPYAGPPGPPYAPTPYGANPYDAKGGPYDGNPYGPYPPGGPGGPQGYWNPGWYAQPVGTNGMAIAALVVSIVVWCVPLLGVVFGIVALRQIRRTGQNGRGLAVAGIVINAVGTLVAALLVTLGVIGALNEGNTDVRDLRPGQCFNTVGSSLSDYSGGGHRSTRVDVVPCRDEHDAEVYADFTLDPSDYPGVDRLSELSGERCSRLAQSYLGDGRLPDGMDVYFYMPPREGWDRGDRSVTCFFGDRGGRVTGSVAAADHGSGVGV